MKKYIALLGLLVFMAMPASAATKKATLINSSGNKVVVEVGSYRAQILFGAGYFLMGSDVSQKKCTVCDNIGASAGPTHYDRQFFLGGYQSGGDVYATTTTAATYTLTNTELGKDTTYISWTPNVNTTLTTMASTSPVFDSILNGKTAGNERSYWLYNASTTVASTITLAAGTGVDFQKNEDTADLATAGTSLSKITFIRKANSDILMVLDQWDVAD